MTSTTPSPTGVPPWTPLREREAREVLCVRAVEEADGEGVLLEHAERRRATEAARSERFEEFLARRARALVEVLDRVHPGLARLRRAAGLRLATAWIVGPALVVGAATNLLGADKRINVVANPLAGLLLWNVAVYVLVLVAALRGRGARTEHETAPAPAGLGPLSRLLTWRARAASGGGERGARGETLARASAAYLASWNRTAAPLLGARLRHALHLGAAALVVGALGGMYARGLLLEYRVTWESTFLDADAVAAWFGVLLRPAAALTGLAVPGADELRALEAPESGPAATWIHLYAATAGLVVLVPRLLLATAAARGARRAAAAVAVDTRPRYYRRLVAGARGAGVRAEVVPYSYTPSAPRLDRLKALLHDVLGARAGIRVRSALEYGAHLAGGADDAGDDHDDVWRVLVFNLGQTPEAEVHGSVLEDLRRDAAAGGACLVLVDAAAWRERAGAASTSPERLDERRRTWDRVVRAAGLEAVHVDLDARADDDLLERVERAAWPPREGVADTTREGAAGR